MVVRQFVLFRLHYHCYNVGGKFRSNCVILSVPISSDQGTEFITVGVDPILFSHRSLSESRRCLALVMSVTFRVATFGTSCP